MTAPCWLADAIVSTKIALQLGVDAGIRCSAQRKPSTRLHGRPDLGADETVRGVPKNQPVKNLPRTGLDVPYRFFIINS
jgi:hypothetical protein